MDCMFRCRHRSRSLSWILGGGGDGARRCAAHWQQRATCACKATCACNWYVVDPGSLFCASDFGAGTDDAHREISAKAASQLPAFQPAGHSRCARFDSGGGDSATAIGPAGRFQEYRRSRDVRHLQGGLTRPDHLAATDQFAWTT